MKLTIFSLLIYFFVSTTIFYTFFLVIQIMKKKYAQSYTIVTKENLNPEVILLGAVNLDDNHSYKPNGFGRNSIRDSFILPLDLIVDGIIIYQNLNAIKKDSVWLTRVLNKKGVSDIKNVTYGVLDTTGKISFTLGRK